MANIETGVALQQDTLSPVAGGPIRTAGVYVLLNGVPTLVQQQVVVLADANGVLIGDPTPLLGQIVTQLADLSELAEDLRSMMAAFVGMPVIDNQATIPAQPNITQ